MDCQFCRHRWEFIDVAGGFLGFWVSRLSGFRPNSSDSDWVDLFARLQSFLLFLDISVAAQQSNGCLGSINESVDEEFVIFSECCGLWSSNWWRKLRRIRREDVLLENLHIIVFTTLNCFLWNYLDTKKASSIIEVAYKDVRRVWATVEFNSIRNAKIDIKIDGKTKLMLLMMEINAEIREREAVAPKRCMSKTYTITPESGYIQRVPICSMICNIRVLI